MHGYNTNGMHRRMTKKEYGMADMELENPGPRGCLSSSAECVKSFLARCLEYCDTYCLVIGFVLILVIGVQFPESGLFLEKIRIHYTCVVLVFFVFGLQLRNTDLYVALKAYRAVLWAVLSILFLTPVLGTQITKTIHFATLSNENMTTEHSIIRANISAIGPTEFAYGLEVFFTVPATFSTGAILAAVAGGNVALGVLLMLITNVAGAFSVPPLLTWLTSLETTHEEVRAFAEMLGMFVLSVLLPIMMGKLFRLWQRLSDSIDAHPKPLRYTVIVLFVVMMWPTISRAQADDSYRGIVRMNTMAILGFTTIMHALFLLINWVAGGITKLDLPIKKTVVIVASHKALPFALTVVDYLPDSAGSRDLMALACTIAYLVVMVIDTLVVSKWYTVEEDPLGHLFTDKEEYRKLSMGE